MKVAYVNKEAPVLLEDIMNSAHEFEKNGELGEAARVYEKAIKRSGLHKHAYERLMIVYHKLNDYDKEMETIDKAIEKFEAYHNQPPKKQPAKKVASLSKAIMRLTGLTDKKGKRLHEPEPLGKWKRRKNSLAKKIEKRNKKK